MYLLLRSPVFTRESQNWLDEFIKGKANWVHISLQPASPSPFSEVDLEHQIRSAYGAENQYLSFVPLRYDLVDQTEPDHVWFNAGEVLKDVLDHKLDCLDEPVQMEVAAWLERSKKLREYYSC